MKNRMIMLSAMMSGKIPFFARMVKAKKTLLFLTALCLSACVSPPQGLEKDDFTIQQLSKIEADDYTCGCQIVRLGGKILSVQALKDQTKVEIMSLPISSFSAKPVWDGATDGRFIANLPGFVDPESLKDQYITVKGRLTGKESGKIDEADYTFPVVDASAFKRWQLVREYYYDPYWDDFYYGFGPRWGYYGGFWHREPRVRTVLR